VAVPADRVAAARGFSPEGGSAAVPEGGAVSAAVIAEGSPEGSEEGISAAAARLENSSDGFAEMPSGLFSRGASPSPRIGGGGASGKFVVGIAEMPFGLLLRGASPIFP